MKEDEINPAKKTKLGFHGGAKHACRGLGRGRGPPGPTRAGAVARSHAWRRLEGERE